VKRVARQRRRGATVIVLLAVVSLLLAASASSAPAGGAARGGQAKPGGGRFKVGFNDAKSDKGRHAQQEMSDDEKVLQGEADDLNKTFALPRDVYINFNECGEANAFYSPEKQEITICYELVQQFYDEFKDDAKGNEKALDDMVGGAVTFTFFHELGHALIHVCDLPVTGKEEDAVDQLSTIILADGTDSGEQMALEGAASFAKESEQELDKDAFADEHSLNQQRFYNIICLLYGHNEQKYASLVKDGVLPQERAERCGEEYQKIQKAWSTLLAPYMKPGE
jgi:hypothetical protein